MNDDLRDFGLIPEFIGRIPVTATLDELSEEELDVMDETVAYGWAEVFVELSDEVAALTALELEFYNLDGDYLFGGTVDEDIVREVMEETDTDEDVSNEDVSADSEEDMILGTWEAVYDLGELSEDAAGMELIYTMIFNADGTVEIEVDAAGEVDSYEGEYYFEDGQLCVDGDFFDYSLTEDTLILDTEEALEEETAFLFPMELTRV